jgi:DNA mismatch endonuclease, patch repair protein
VTDIVTPEKRSQMMSGIRGKNTRPELVIRKALHRAGFRYRLHDKKLPGKPDLVFPKYRAVIFVHGCFWHGHDCHLFKWHKTRPAFWNKKITGNKANDDMVMTALNGQGWRTLIIWECAIKGKMRLTFSDLMLDTNGWLRNGIHNIEIRGLNRESSRGA